MRWLIGAFLIAALVAPSSAAAFTITEFESQAGAPAGSHAPRYIQPGPDGALWCTDSGPWPGIGHITTAGLRLAPIPDPRVPVDLVVAPDRAVGGGVPGGGTTGTVPRCTGRPATIIGTPGPDRLTRTARADVIVGLGGDDRISGLGGAEAICGGSGADVLLGGRGADRLNDEAGPASISGGPGGDVLLGGLGADRLLGGAGGDTLSGGAGRKVLTPGPQR